MSGRSHVELNWRVNLFRAERFKALWSRPAAMALDYGAHSYSFAQNKDDPLKFKQVAYFDTKHDWERYWYSDEIADARTQIAGLYQIPLTYEWYAVIGADERTLETVGEGGAAEEAAQ